MTPLKSGATMGDMEIALTEAAEINNECKARHKSLSKWVKKK